MNLKLKVKLKWRELMRSKMEKKKSLTEPLGIETTEFLAALVKSYNKKGI